MDILLTQIILCGMFGLITGLVASFVLLERENTVLVLYVACWVLLQVCGFLYYGFFDWWYIY